MEGPSRRFTQVLDTIFSGVRHKRFGERARPESTEPLQPSLSLLDQSPSPQVLVQTLGYVEPPRHSSSISRSSIESSTPSVTAGHRGIVTPVEWPDDHIIRGAEYDSIDRSPPPRCFPGTRTQLLSSISQWFFEKGRQKAMLWLNGPAGVGKTAIVQSLAESLAMSGNLAASLFISRSNNSRDLSCVFATIGYQLASKIPSYKTYIAGQTALDPLVPWRKMEEQFQTFITEPFGNKKVGGQKKPWVVLLDGLDECEGLGQQREILRLISGFILCFPDAPLVWVISSRSEAHLSRWCTDSIVVSTSRFEHVPICSSEARRDVDHYLNACFKTMREHNPSLPIDWPSEAQILKLANGASGFLFFAESAVNFIGDTNYADPVSRLNVVLSVIDGSESTIANDQRPFAPLDAMYTQILTTIPPFLWGMTKQVLGFILCARGGHDFHRLPESLFAASTILHFNPNQLYDSLQNLHPVLKVPHPQHAHKRGALFLHGSFADYLVDPNRSQEFCISVHESLDNVVNGISAVYAGRHRDGRQLYQIPVEGDGVYDDPGRNTTAAINYIETVVANSVQRNDSPLTRQDASRKVENNRTETEALNISSKSEVELGLLELQEEMVKEIRNSTATEGSRIRQEVRGDMDVQGTEPPNALFGLEESILEDPKRDLEVDTTGLIPEGSAFGNEYLNVTPALEEDILQVSKDEVINVTDYFSDGYYIARGELLSTQDPGHVGVLREDFSYDLTREVMDSADHAAAEDRVTQGDAHSFTQQDQLDNPGGIPPGIPFDNTPALFQAQDSEDVTHLLQTRILASKDCYKTLLDARGSEAQRILDLLQNLLNAPHMIGEKTRRSILTALLRLSVSSGLYPRQLKLNEIEKESSPTTAGQFGEIWKGKYQNRPVCLKIFKLYQQAQVDHLLKNFSREAIVWSQLSHPNVLPFYGIYHLNDTYGRVGLVSPWMGNGNLTEYLGAHPDSKRLPLVHEVLAGLRYLHRNQVIHGDLKGVNILINADGSACLADFGLSSVMDADILRWSSLNTITQFGGTVRWMAPENIESTEDGVLRPSFASDIYSLASVMFEIYTGQIPYHEYPKNITVLSKVLTGVKPRKPEPGQAPELGEHIWEIMEDCWNTNPDDRPTLDQVIDRVSIDALHRSQAQPARVELRNSMADTLIKSDMLFLMNLLNLD